MSDDQSADYRIRDLERRASDLQNQGAFAQARDVIEDIDTVSSQLLAKLQAARTRGYVFKSYLEEQIQSLQAQWRTMRGDVRREIERRSRDLENDLHQAERAVRRLASYKGRSLRSAQSAIDRVESELGSVERQVRAATDAVTGMYDTIQSDVREIDSQVDECLEMLDLMDQASFGFQLGEAGVAAVRARWLKDGRKEGPKGILFLTDRRIIFEQREKVAKKKLLFITTASEKIQEMQWEAPLGALVETMASEQRRALVLKKERLTLHFKPPATVRQIILELSADSDDWRALIGRVLSGEIDRERTVAAKDAAVQEAAVEIPSRCPSCGAGLDVNAVKGMAAVKCVYCGTSIPLAWK
jgi:hypothetical protein